MRCIFLFFLAFFFVFAASTPAFAAARSLSVGMSGADVTTLQKALIAGGYLAPGNAIGYFGLLTQAAVKKFQCAKDIICAGTAVMGYGVAGPRTQAALFAAGQPASIESGVPLGPAWRGALEFSGWVPTWNASTSTADVTPHLGQLKSVMPFGYGVNSDGTLAGTARFAGEPWQSFIAAAKARGVRVVPSIMWGNGEAIHRILSNATTRIALEDEIAALVKQNGFDGIDIDFEAKKAETIDYFSTFLKGLYARMGTKWVYCTVEARMPLEHRYSPGATIPADATNYANDYRAMNKYCDRVEIMAYDQGTIDVQLNAARSAPYAPVADPAWVESLVSLAAQSIARNKLVIGVPTYGYEYRVTPLAGGGFQYKMLWPFTQRYGAGIAAQLGITPHRTSANEIGFTYDDRALLPAPAAADSTQTQQAPVATTSVAQNLGSQVGGTQPFNYMTWSDAQAVKDKVDLAKRLGVRGVAVFSFGGEDPRIWDMLK